METSDCQCDYEFLQFLIVYVTYFYSHKCSQVVVMGDVKSRVLSFECISMTQSHTEPLTLPYLGKFAVWSLNLRYLDPIPAFLIP